MTLTNISKDSLIRLENAAKIAFPDGSVTLNALRNEIKAGRLTATLIGGKHLTSLSEIEKMSEKCRVNPSHQDSGIESRDLRKMGGAQRRASTSSSTTDVNTARDAAKATVQALKKRLQNTSRPNTSSPKEDVK